MIPRCRCGRKAIAVSPGSEAIYAPGHILVTRAKPAKAWCKLHWLPPPRTSAPRYASRLTAPQRLATPCITSQRPAALHDTTHRCATLRSAPQLGSTPRNATPERKVR
jgi:hypothetical protein